MKPQDLQQNLELLFGQGHSPGQAFDALVRMRQDGVTLRMVQLHLSDSITQTELAMETPAGNMVPLPKYTENTPMPFGKHRGTPLRSLPSGYLAWLFRQGRDLHDKDLAEFLSTYKRAIGCSIANPTNNFGEKEEWRDPEDDEDCPF